MIWELHANLTGYRVALPNNSADWPLLQSSKGVSMFTEWEPVSIRFMQSDEPGVEISDGEVPNELLPVGDFVPIIGGIPIFSRRSVETLSDLIAGDVELLEVNCPSESGSFYAVNVVKIVDCLDPKLARIGLGPGGIPRIWQYAFKPSCLQGIHMFKLVQDPVVSIYVSEEFKRRVEASQLTGFKFEELTGMLYW